jgi:photosystem II stability/assembly factor-like uncharacterized protein
MKVLQIAVMFALVVVPLAHSQAAVEIKSAQLLAPQKGWAASDRLVYWTKDGGSDWTNITPQTTSRGTICSVFFLDDSNGWVLSTDLKPDATGETQFELASTKNGGASWSSTLLPSSHLIEKPWNAGRTCQVDFVDDNNGWAILSLAGSSNLRPGVLIRTTDGGKTWSKAPKTQPGVAGEVRFVDQENGWLAGGPDDRYLYVTHDEARTWKRVDFRAPSQLSRNSYAQYHTPAFLDSQNGYISVTYSQRGKRAATLVTYKTENGGHTWTLDKVIPDASKSGIRANAAFADSDLVTVSTEDSKGIANVRRFHTRSVVSTAEVPIASDDQGQTAAVWKLAFANDLHGWMLTSAGLFSTRDGGTTWIKITPKREQTVRHAEISTAAGALLASRQFPFPPSFAKILAKKKSFGFRRPIKAGFQQLSQGKVSRTSFVEGVPPIVHMGFDTCSYPDQDVMSAWWNHSPYYDVGIYIGGISRSCPEDIPSAWIGSVRSQGWGLMPLWAGPQSPCGCRPGTGTYPNCTQFPHVFSTNPDTAYDEGFAEAETASSTASNLGLGGLDGAIIYYNFEPYDQSFAECSAAANAFLDGWTTGVELNAFDAGAYGSPGPAASWASLQSPPNNVWVAKYDNRATIWGLNYGLIDSMWSSNQRIHQFANGDDSWGGVTLNIDKNIVNAEIIEGNGLKSYGLNSGDILYGNAPLAEGTNALHDVVGFDGPDGFLITNGGAGIVGCGGTTYRSAAYGINYAEEIVGECDGPQGAEGFVDRINGGGISTVGGLGTASGINDDGQIVGSVSDAQGTHGVFVTDSGTTYLDSSDQGTVVTGINGASQAVGYYYDFDGIAHGFLYTDWYPGTGQPQFFPVDIQGADETYASGINNNGQIVGWYYTDDWYTLLGFLYDPKRGFITIDLNTPGDVTSWTAANGINDLGEAVGAHVRCDDCNSEAFRTTTFH